MVPVDPSLILLNRMRVKSIGLNDRHRRIGFQPVDSNVTRWKPILRFYGDWQTAQLPRCHFRRPERNRTHETSNMRLQSLLTAELRGAR